MKNKNLWLLPTDKTSRLSVGNNGNFVFGILRTSVESYNNDFTNQHIYITSDEEIKEGDWFIANNGVHKCIRVNKNTSCPFITLNSKGEEIGHFKTWKTKIILTTNQDLIGVQAIDDEFLEWFVKNPSCEWVEINILCYGALSGYADAGYKIIIPKEEPFIDFTNTNDCTSMVYNSKEEPKQEGYICPHTKVQCDDECCVSAEDCHIKSSIGILSEPKQETLEEVAEKMSTKDQRDKMFQKLILIHAILSTNKFIDYKGQESLSDDINDFIGKMHNFQLNEIFEGKKLYSEEEVEDLIYNVCGTVARLQGITLNGNHIDSAYKQFKK